MATGNPQSSKPVRTHVPDESEFGSPEPEISDSGRKDDPGTEDRQRDRCRREPLRADLDTRCSRADPERRLQEVRETGEGGTEFRGFGPQR